MKRTVLLFYIVIIGLLLTGCNEQEQVVHVISPAGGPTLSIIQLIQDFDDFDNLSIEYEVVANPQFLSDKISTKSHEIVIAPLNVGANLYNKGSNYLYAGTVTFGNLYLVGTTDSTLEEIKDQEIAAFGEGQIPGIMLKEILKDQNVYNENHLTYFNAVNDVQFQLLSGEYNYALLAEPALSATKLKMKSELNKDLYIIADIQEIYQDLSGQTSYPQAGIFINKDFYDKNKSFVSEFLKKVEESATFVNENSSTAATYYQDAFESDIIPSTIPAPVLISAIPGSNIGFSSANDSKAMVNHYLEMIYAINPKLVGGKIPDDAFYLVTD